jgi:hypothetical protein
MGGQSRYRLLLFGERHGSQDFDTLAQLLRFLSAAGVAVDADAISLPDSQTSCILLSQTVELSGAEVSRLGLK